jgi:NitT/TauT family transport system ATP-binding protein
MPGASMKLEGALAAPQGVGSHKGPLTLGPDRFFDGRVFDPHHVDAYLADLTER